MMLPISGRRESNRGPASQRNGDAAQESGAAAMEAAGDAAQWSAAGPVADAGGRRQNRSGPRLWIREDQASQKGRGSDAHDLLVSTRQNQAPRRRAAGWPLLTAHKPIRGRSRDAVGPVYA